MMISTVVIFVLAFAALGLLLGFAATFDVHPQHERATSAGVGPSSNNGSNTSITFGDQVNVQVKPAGQ
ncbi:MAG TPA: hypothetical protein VFT58_04735 [Nitrososphaera sp.]|nr:hypothetical protein [Nitrososphaera sp.]